MSIYLERFDGMAITNEMIVAAADLFSQNYGVWGPQAAQRMGVKRLKHGARIKMSPTHLARQILSSGAENKYVRAIRDDELVGNVFGTRWMCDGRSMLWVTQLCVKSGHRSRGVAKQLLELLRDDECAVGVLSSHAHAILAVLHVYGNSTEMVDLEMTQKNARAIMESCPVQYVRNAKLHGSFFGKEGNGSVSSADTQFWVDHEEPLEALCAVRRKGTEWPLGELPDGHEFLIVVDVKNEGSMLGENILKS